jgi:hypothetical protein
MKATFKVQHEVLSGLKYIQVVKRHGVRVSKDEEMIVSIYCGLKTSSMQHEILIPVNERDLSLPTLLTGLPMKRSVSGNPVDTDIWLTLCSCLG